MWAVKTATLLMAINTYYRRCLRKLRHRQNLRRCILQLGMIPPVVSHQGWRGHLLRSLVSQLTALCCYIVALAETFVTVSFGVMGSNGCINWSNSLALLGSGSIHHDTISPVTTLTKTSFGIREGTFEGSISIHDRHTYACSAFQTRLWGSRVYLLIWNASNHH